jgi:hypothetical protein
MISKQSQPIKFTRSQWRECLELARHQAQALEFVKAVETCLRYLNEHHPEASYKCNEAFTDSDLGIYIACGGEANRWDSFMGIPKQLVDPGDGVPLVQRTVNQLSKALPGKEINVIIRKGDGLYGNIQGASLIHRRDDIDRPTTLEILEHKEGGRDSKTNVLWIYGDAYLSDSGICKIRDQVVKHAYTFCIFGRKTANEIYGTKGGEDFAVYAPAKDKTTIIEYYRFLRRLYCGTPLHKYGTWEMISLLSSLKSDQEVDICSPELVNGRASDTYDAIATMRESKDFHSLHWVDIDDESEDFDFAYEYIERLFRTVIWVGSAEVCTHNT